MSMQKIELLFNVIVGVMALGFVVAGGFMLTPHISPDIHKRMLKEFEDYAKVHPAVHFGYAIDASKFMLQIGAIEVVCGLLILIGPKMTKILSCLVLSSLTVGGVYFAMQLKRAFSYQVFGAAVLLLFLIQVNILTTKRDAAQKEEEKKQQDVTTKKSKKAKKE